MRKWTLTLAISLIAANSAAAEEPAASDPLSPSRFSVQTGVGFFAEDNFDGFAWSGGGSYHIDENWSVGVDLQVGVDDDFTFVSMPFFARYDFGDLPTDAPVLSQTHFFAKTGLGFTWAEFDGTVGPLNIKVDEDDTGVLWVIGGGVEYSFDEHFSLESQMLFNVTSNDLFDDDFYYSWQVIALRYRF